jgi:hypothetical protein
MCSSGPCERRINLRRKERFSKSARAIIQSNCLLPALSDGGLKLLVTSFECFGVCRGGDCCAHGEKDFISGDRR